MRNAFTGQLDADIAVSGNAAAVCVGGGLRLSKGTVFLLGVTEKQEHGDSSEVGAKVRACACVRVLACLRVCGSVCERGTEGEAVVFVDCEGRVARFARSPPGVSRLTRESFFCVCARRHRPRRRAARAPWVRRFPRPCTWASTTCRCCEIPRRC